MGTIRSEGYEQRRKAERKAAENLDEATTFCEWLKDQRGRDDDAGRVAEYLMETESGGWPHSGNHGTIKIWQTAFRVRESEALEYFVILLRNNHNMPDSSIETFREVWAEFQEDRTRWQTERNDRERQERLAEKPSGPPRDF